MKKCWKILFGVIGCLAVFGLVCVILGYCLGGMEQAYRRNKMGRRLGWLKSGRRCGSGRMAKGMARDQRISL